MPKKKGEVEVIKPKKKHTIGDVLEAPFGMMDYMVKADEQLAAYREQELELLGQILAELKKLTSSETNGDKVNKE